MKLIKNIEKSLNSRGGAYIFAVLSAFACAFLYGADFAYEWIAVLYPLGEASITLMFSLIIFSFVFEILFIILKAVFADKSITEKKPIRAVNIIVELLSLVLFVYTLILVFGLDSGVSSQNIQRAATALYPLLAYLIAVISLPLVLVFSESGKKAIKSTIAVLAAFALFTACFNFQPSSVGGSSADSFVAPKLQSENLLKDASIAFESLLTDEKADAQNLLDDSNNCWSPQSPNGEHGGNTSQVNNAYTEIELENPISFNTAVIEELGNQVQYFRLQAYVNNAWQLVYQSEKIQSLRLCTFDTVTTDRIRLSIDKFRDDGVEAKIKSVKLYNEPQRAAENFEVTTYQRLDNDIPTEVLAKGEEYVKNYAKFYDVYTTVIVFGAIGWEENGEISYGEKGEEYFARQIEALKEIISYRSDKSHEVKLIITGLADGTGGAHGGVNVFMSNNGDRVAEEIINMVLKYDFDGVDVDWEYPQTAEDWANYDEFMQKLDEGISADGKERILSTALSSSTLGLDEKTYEIIDQIQFMAYDGHDIDGFQSSLEQAQSGIADFKNNGADISKINIGIAAYGRPLNLTPYWPLWRGLEQANYWDSKYYNINDLDQVYDAAYCSPALAGDKTAYALFSGCGGVMVFRVDCDKTMDNEASVTGGIKNAVDRFIAD